MTVMPNPARSLSPATTHLRMDTHSRCSSHLIIYAHALCTSLSTIFYWRECMPF
ncbi:hypothetical protein BV22DRAFT_1090790 [Leucogyrophana mollusca]|uniref:Uncharacterized protein n=1 Tax=Leucogyrophana mollusca TaxID=85980 RepID=A0ACB8BGT3_9AGAM|nr:hypothetical protein BV22DRAFT_1090790 [Leucogyrophana mollusca]